MVIHADKDSPRANGEGWHTDVSCDPEPPMGWILYIKKCPPRGGDTLFANMYAAYEALRPHEGLSRGTDRAPRRRGIPRPVHQLRRQGQGELSLRRPPDRPHPSGHRAARGSTSIPGSPAISTASRATRAPAILRYLYEHMANPLFQCRFRWQENSIAFWDNRCVQHHAMWDYWPHTRSGNRVTVKGDRPV